MAASARAPAWWQGRTVIRLGWAVVQRSSTHHGAVTDYVGMRAMVNGTDHAADIAAIARQFETILLDAKP
jgi:hypothetical protein